MSRPTLNSVVRKGAALPVSLQENKQASLEPMKEVIKEPSEQATKEESQKVAVTRRRPWDNQDQLVKANYEVPQRVQTKLHTLKAWQKIPNLKDFVAKTLEAALDKEIAKAEKEGY
jgi:hypothetical protein